METIYILPIIGALIGWFTNYIAVKMLFHPRNEIKFLFFKIQGIFPKRQKALAQKVGQLVSTELFTGEDIAKAVKSGAKTEEILFVLDEHLEKIITEKIPQVAPMLTMFLNSELVTSIKEIFKEDMLEIVYGMAEKVSTEVEQKLNIKEVVENKISNFSIEKLEALIFEVMKKEFKFIEIFGAIIGFLIGLIQILLISDGFNNYINNLIN